MASYLPKGLSPYDPGIALLRGDHHELPSMLLEVGHLNPLRDENITYAQARQGAGSPAGVIVCPSSPHGFLQLFKNKQQSADGEQAVGDGARFLLASFNRTQGPSSYLLRSGREKPCTS